MSRRRRGPLPPLPRPCVDCRPYGGLWKRNVNGGLERCDCDRARELFRRSPEGKRAAREAARAARRDPKPFDPRLHGEAPE